VTTPTRAGRVFDLLPAVYRERDARPDGAPGFLQTLLTVVADQLALVDADLDQLYNDLFIETCDAWVVPYIGDLVAVTPGAPTDDSVLTRAAVANAIALRRRKGTAAVLEQLARDYTGWPAVAVEMFERTAIAQHLQHVVRTRGRTVSVRSPLPLERIGGSFDSSAHTLEVRRIGSGRGRYNVQNVAVMVWRDVALQRTWVDAKAVDGHRFRFNPLGWDQQLVTQVRPELALVHQASALNVPGPITRRMMAATPSAYYGAGLSVVVWRSADADPVGTSDVVVCDLGDTAPDDAAWSNVDRLSANQVAIDPQLGRLALGSAQATAPRVSFVITQPSPIGGGELIERPDTPVDSPVTKVRRDGVGGAATTIAGALAATGGAGTIEIGDSRTYTGDLAVSVSAAAELRVVSLVGALPVIDLATGWAVSIGERGVLTLVGLIIAGGPLIVRGRPDRIEIVDCTFVPGQRLDFGAEVVPPVGPSLVLDLDPDWQTEVVLTNCITGPLIVPADGSTLAISDSIVDGVLDGLGEAAPTGAPAEVVAAVRSVESLTGLVLPAGSTSLWLTLGTDAPRLITLAAVPADGVAAAAALDSAFAGSGARAVAIGDRVVVVGDGRPLTIAGQPGSGLADGLGLVGPAARVQTIVGAPADLAATAAGGTFAVTDRHGASFLAHLAAGAADAGTLAGLVQTAVRNADPSLASVIVGVLDDRLVVVADASAVTLAATVNDLTTAGALGLVSPRPAIAGDPAGSFGATLSLTRCTVFGAIDATAIDVVTDSIITGRLTSDRRQIGCVQYSWIAPGSSTARQHACQPATTTTPPPRFVSQRFGTPGYARLRRGGATAIIRGASDGFEMGALAGLRQTQRDDNLRRGIEEFLRFGLEAGVLDGT